MAIEDNAALDGIFKICERIITLASELSDIAVGKETNQEDVVQDAFTKLKRTVDDLSQEELQPSILLLKRGIARLPSLKLAERSTGRLGLEEYAKSKECFEEAKLAATEVFSDISIKAEVLILAAVIRITARILGWLDNPYVAGVACKLFLQDLHDLPVIQGILKEGALKGNDSEEARQVVMRKSIGLIDDRVRHFVTTSTQLPVTVMCWPMPMAYTSQFHGEIRDEGMRAFPCPCWPGVFNPSTQFLGDKSHRLAKDSKPNKHCMIRDARLPVTIVGWPRSHNPLEDGEKNHDPLR